ncbi:serine acetyltransferase [Leuconostoc litchii]|uniref:Serine acetyltransferase n=1 Tax=Leuconostoc litchii TaxID=1981069 RepID=A0A6P2CR42_9LACO|nr:serine O-acetyltransferase EpsC [Leuconostoc litchii]TYC46797.1 serine acetyltransferase [Leuconostoc litchii]GMA70686.1 serine acetyltransferase [Leuconostoc litchii]
MFLTAKSILKRDPAAKSLIMVILTYPGLHALGFHRIAHWLHIHHHYMLAAIIARWSAKHTDVFIAPGAQIGHRLFIDHGIGVVIGETAIIDDDVTILHGVTLGARHQTAGRRHPHIGKNTFIGAHAQILGNITVGSHSKIGANAVVLKDIPAHATAVGNPAHLV